jgi:hypothetical protein
VRRRNRARGPGVPEELARFAVSDWPEAGCAHEALRAWQAGCLAWLAAGAGRVFPFGEYGDVIDVLRESRRYREQMPPCPAEARPAVHWLNGPPESKAGWLRLSRLCDGRQKNARLSAWLMRTMQPWRWPGSAGGRAW